LTIFAFAGFLFLIFALIVTLFKLTLFTLPALYGKSDLETFFGIISEYDDVTIFGLSLLITLDYNLKLMTHSVTANGNSLENSIS